MHYDLIVRNGHLLDPAQGLDRLGSIAFSAGKVAAIDVGESDTAASTIDAGGHYVTPGLIDLHTHVYVGGTSLGVDPDELARSSAVTTLVDAGSAGAANIAGFRAHVIERADVRILAYLNISFAGIFGFGGALSVGEGWERRLLGVRECVAAVRDHRDIIVGIKARVGPSSSGDSVIDPLKLALQAADELDLPIMVHVEMPPPTIDEIADLLRPGDVLTHCCRPYPNAVVSPRSGEVNRSCLVARERGVLFDTGHGRGSFDYASFRRMQQAGFLPDVISSDVHLYNRNGPAIDLLTTMNKALALGTVLADVVTMATTNAAAALRRPELGTLKVGAVGDASLFSIEDTPSDLFDSLGARLVAPRSLRPHGTINGGVWREALR